MRSKGGEDSGSRGRLHRASDRRHEDADRARPCERRQSPRSPWPTGTRRPGTRRGTSSYSSNRRSCRLPLNGHEVLHAQGDESFQRGDASGDAGGAVEAWSLRVGARDARTAAAPCPPRRPWRPLYRSRLPGELPPPIRSCRTRHGRSTRRCWVKRAASTCTRRRATATLPIPAIRCCICPMAGWKRTFRTSPPTSIRPFAPARCGRSSSWASRTPSGAVT